MKNYNAIKSHGEGWTDGSGDKAFGLQARGPEFGSHTMQNIYANFHMIHTCQLPLLSILPE